MFKTETQALLYGLSAVLLWSTVATAFKIGLQQTSVLLLLTGASAFSLCLLSVVLLLRKELATALSSLWQHRTIAFKLGLLNPVLYYLILFEAYDRLPAQIAQPINYTWGIVLGLLAVPFLGRKITRWDIFGMLIAYSGVFIISMAGKGITGELDYSGIALAIFSTLLWAFYWLMNTKDSREPIIGLFQNFFYGFPILLLLCVVSGASFQWSLVMLGSMAYIGCFEMGLAFIFWQLALQKTEHTARMSSLIFLSPFISLFIINKTLGEPLQLLTFVGLVVILIGLALQRVGKA